MSRRSHQSISPSFSPHGIIAYSKNTIARETCFLSKYDGTEWIYKILCCIANSEYQGGDMPYTTKEISLKEYDIGVVKVLCREFLKQILIPDDEDFDLMSFEEQQTYFRRIIREDFSYSVGHINNNALYYILRHVVNDLNLYNILPMR